MASSRTPVSLTAGAADLYVWPGFEEAYGLSYLEAQAHGVAVWRGDEGGVSAVVRHGRRDC